MTLETSANRNWESSMSIKARPETGVKALGMFEARGPSLDALPPASRIALTIDWPYGDTKRR